jgi:hypothetical protein
MSENHPSPSPEFIKQLEDDWFHCRKKAKALLIQAFQVGADQELEKCCLWMERNLDDWDNRFSDELRAARRPKPPSLKEQALEELYLSYEEGYLKVGAADTIRRALEALPE